MKFISGPTDNNPDIGRPMNLDDDAPGDGFVSDSDGTFGADTNDPDVGRPANYEQSADYGDQPVLRREVRTPSPRDMVNRRPPLPKFFRAPGAPDMSEGKRGASWGAGGISADEEWIHIEPDTDEIQHMKKASGIATATIGSGSVWTAAGRLFLAHDLV